MKRVTLFNQSVIQSSNPYHCGSGFRLICGYSHRVRHSRPLSSLIPLSLRYSLPHTHAPHAPFRLYPSRGNRATNDDETIERQSPKEVSASHLFIPLLILVSACVKKECKNPITYEFEIPVTLSPAKTTYQIGDTINISSVFSDEVLERRTDQFYHLKDFRFFPETLVGKIDTVSAMSKIATLNLGRKVINR